MAPCPWTPRCCREALRAVVDPELGDDIVDLGMVRSISVGPDATVTVEVALTVAACPLRNQIEADVRGRLATLPGWARWRSPWARWTPPSGPR